MKIMSGFITIILAFVITSGCAGNQGLVKPAGIDTRQDVFQEIPRGAAPKPGYADLRVYSSLKTHIPGIYSSKDVHGTDNFKLMLNIGGQELLLRGDPRRENSESMALRDPEAGDGIRYQFSNNIRIKAGTHRLVISIPGNGIEIKRVINLADGSRNSLTLEPVYNPVPGKRRPGFYGATSFTEGLDGFRLIVNGKTM